MGLASRVSRARSRRLARGALSGAQCSLSPHVRAARHRRLHPPTAHAQVLDDLIADTGPALVHVWVYAIPLTSWRCYGDCTSSLRPVLIWVLSPFSHYLYLYDTCVLYYPISLCDLIYAPYALPLHKMTCLGILFLINEHCPLNHLIFSFLYVLNCK